MRQQKGLVRCHVMGGGRPHGKASVSCVRLGGVAPVSSKAHQPGEGGG